jgi:hypothetical protein
MLRPVESAGPTGRSAQLRTQQVREWRRARAPPGAGTRRRTQEAGRDGPELTASLKALVDPATRGDPMSLLVWTTKSTKKLVGALSAMGHRVSGTARLRGCFETWGSACRATRKSSRVVTTRTGRPVRLPQRHRRRTRPGRAAGGLGSTPRRRSWSGNARTGAASTSRRGNPNASASTTTRSRDLCKGIRRRNASPLVGNHRHGSLPGRRPAAGLRRRRRVHRRPDLGLEDRARRTRRRDRPGDHRLLLSRPGPASGSRSNIGCSPRSPCTNATTPPSPRHVVTTRHLLASP